MKVHSLVPNMFIHNVRELLENAAIGEDGCSIAEIVELSLLNQSKLSARIILKQDDLHIELAINLGIVMDKRVMSVPWLWSTNHSSK